MNLCNNNVRKYSEIKLEFCKSIWKFSFACVVFACRIVFCLTCFLMLFSYVSFCHCAMLWHHNFLPLFHQLILPTGFTLWALTFTGFFLEKFCQPLACCYICKVWSCLSCHYYVLLLHTLCHNNFIFFVMNALEGWLQ